MNFFRKWAREMRKRRSVRRAKKTLKELDVGMERALGVITTIEGMSKRTREDQEDLDRFKEIYQDLKDSSVSLKATIKKYG